MADKIIADADCRFIIECKAGKLIDTSLGELWLITKYTGKDNILTVIIPEHCDYENPEIVYPKVEYNIRIEEIKDSQNAQS